VVEHKQPQIEPLDNVREEIRLALQIDKVTAQEAELGQTILNNLQSGSNIDTLLETQDLRWNRVEDLERNNQFLPPELVNNVFSVAAPEDGDVAYAGFQLSNGVYVVVELQDVEAGSMEDFEEAQLANLKSVLAQQYANEDLQALITGLQDRANITR
jgi:peptidyl-prolyl cis-trans isomerase D